MSLEKRLEEMEWHAEMGLKTGFPHWRHLAHSVKALVAVVRAAAVVDAHHPPSKGSLLALRKRLRALEIEHE